LGKKKGRTTQTHLQLRKKTGKNPQRGGSSQSMRNRRGWSAGGGETSIKNQGSEIMTEKTIGPKHDESVTKKKKGSGGGLLSVPLNWGSCTGQARRKGYQPVVNWHIL